MKVNRSDIALVSSFVVILIISIGIMLVSYDIVIQPETIEAHISKVKGIEPGQAAALSRAINNEIGSHNSRDQFFRQLGSIVILFYGAVVYFLFFDIRLRKQIERQQAAQYRITQTLSEHLELHDAAPALLRAIAETTQSQVGVVWIVDSQSNRLRFVDIWRSHDFQGQSFANATRGSTFESGVGVPGRAWSTAKAHWIPDIVHDDNMPRNSEALADGLRSAFVFPIRMGAEVVGVMEFFCTRVRKADNGLLKLCDAIGSQIGQFILRENVQVMRDESARRLRTLTEAIPHIVWTADDSGQIDFFNSRLVEYTGLNAEQSMDEAWKLLIHPEDRRKYLEEWQHAIETGDTFELEFRLKRVAGLPNSDYRWQLGRAVALRDQEGDISEWFGTWTDIDAQKVVRR